METLRFNTSIARIYELNNHLTHFADTAVPREVAEPMVLLLAPLAPHAAEELWQRLGHDHSLAWERFPEADPALLVEDTVEIAVQVNGKVKAHCTVAAGLDPKSLEDAVRADPKVAALLAEVTVRKVIAVPDRLVSFVVG
jgi:leucyl-tRNA synthetase